MNRSQFLKLLATGAVAATLPVRVISSAMREATEADLVDMIWQNARWMPTPGNQIHLGGRDIYLPTYYLRAPDKDILDAATRFAIGRDLIHGARVVGGWQGVTDVPKYIPSARELLGHSPGFSDTMGVVVTYNWDHSFGFPDADPEYRRDQSAFLCTDPAMLRDFPKFNGQQS